MDIQLLVGDVRPDLSGILARRKENNEVLFLNVYKPSTKELVVVDQEFYDKHRVYLEACLGHLADELCGWVSAAPYGFPVPEDEPGRTKPLTIKIKGEAYRLWAYPVTGMVADPDETPCLDNYSSRMMFYVPYTDTLKLSDSLRRRELGWYQNVDRMRASLPYDCQSMH